MIDTANKQALEKNQVRILCERAEGCICSPERGGLRPSLSNLLPTFGRRKALFQRRAGPCGPRGARPDLYDRRTGGYSYLNSPDLRVRALERRKSK